MAFAKAAPVLSVFMGGCLSGAALLGLWGTTNDTSSNHAVPPSDHPSTEEAERIPDEAEIERERPVVAQIDVTRKDDDVQLDEADDLGRSAADVLAYLEEAYQEKLAGSSQDATDQHTDDDLADADAEAADADLAEADDVPPPIELDETTTDAALAVRSDERDGLVDNDVRVVFNHTDTQQNDEHHGDLVVGDKIQGAKVGGDVHIGDVNQVQQVALLYYQSVFVLPQGALSQTTTGTPKLEGRRPINPFGSVMISPEHDPWKTSLAEPGSPWSSVRRPPR